MKLFIPIFLTILLSTNVSAQSSLFERDLQKADALWKSNQLSLAIDQYKLAIANDTVPDAYKSLIYLRLAQAQFEAKLTKDCRETLTKSKSLQVLPAHHQLIIDELEKKLEGITLMGHTPIPGTLKAAASLYVAPSTDNANNSFHGKLVYKTLNEALEALPSLLKQKNLPKGPIEIILQGDIYDSGEPIQLQAENSGTKDNPLVIRSVSSEKHVIINGGKALSIWQRETNPEILARLPESSRSKVWVADLSENKVQEIDSLVFGGFSSKRADGGNATFITMPVPELFHKGIPQQMARWPNERDTIVALKDFKSERSLKWAADKDVWLHGYWFHLWADAYEKMDGVSLKDSTIQIQPPMNNYGFAKSKWHIVNALSELDKPGEWCISVSDQKIWYIPVNDLKPDQMILSMKGPALIAENCNYLTIKGLDLQYIRGDGMIFTNCSNLTIANCSVSNSSGLGIKIAGGHSHLVHSCIIESMGRGGIDISAGDQLKLIKSGSIIENCKISNLSRIDRTYTPAIVLAGDGLKVRYCLFANIPSSGVRLEGNDMLVELNEFTKCVIESDDQGAIDVWGNPLYRGNIIRWNFFHNIGVPNLHMAAGVRLDDAISGFGIYENLFLRSSNNMFGGIQIHGGKDNYLEGNIFGDCHAAISQSAWGDKRWKEAFNTADHPVYMAIHSTDWQSEFWQKRYPALNNLLADSDINYAIDNVVINAETLILRKSKRFEFLNNCLLKSETHPVNTPDFKNYLVPWHRIPLDKIGTYK